VGKTSLARSVTATLGPDAHWVAGTESGRDIPLGTFAHLLPAPVPGDPITLLANALDVIRDRKYSVIGIDDIHLADHLSATLLHQLAVEGTVRIVATARSGEPVPETVTALWKDGYLTRLDVTPLTRPEAIALVEAALGGRLEELSADLIWQASIGNPLYVRHLIEGALDAGTLRQVNGVWQLRGQVSVTTKLTALLDNRLERLGEEEIRALELLAAGQPLTLAVMSELVDGATLERVEQLGLIAVADDNGTARVDFAHALIGDVIRQRTGRLATRRLKAELLAVLSNHPADGPAERIRRAELAVAAGGPVDNRLLVRAAADAIALMNIDLAERFARLAQKGGGGFPAGELLARSLMLQGKTLDADAVLASYDPDSLTEFEFARWGIARIANLRWSVGDAEAAEQILDVLQRRVVHPGIRQVLDGIRSALLVLDGHLQQAAELADHVLSDASAPPVAVGWAVFGGGMSAALNGRTADAARLADRGRDLYPHIDALMRFMLALGEVRALTLAGDFDTAQSIVRITSPSQFRARAMAQVLAATVEVGRGRLRTAMERLEENLAALSGETAAAWILPARLLLAQCYCGLGMDESAGLLVAELGDRVGRGGQSFAPSVRIAEAWLAAAEGQLRAAIAAAVHAADLAAEGGQRAVELMALHAAARFGDMSALPRLIDVADAVGGPLAAADSAHAAGLLNRDGAAVYCAAAEFERIGALLSAADAAAQAAMMFDAAGERRNSLEAAAMAHRLAAECGGLRTPAQMAASDPLPLSAREREIANLVARGLNNREIAERLVVSRRTVEGHLYRIFAKLDVLDRHDLAALISRESG
jgi:DNA-binding CsgD family transcriptional regulator